MYVFHSPLPPNEIKKSILSKQAYRQAAEKIEDLPLPEKIQVKESLAFYFFSWLGNLVDKSVFGFLFGFLFVVLTLSIMVGGSGALIIYLTFPLTNSVNIAGILNDTHYKVNHKIEIQEAVEEVLKANK